MFGFIRRRPLVSLFLGAALAGLIYLAAAPKGVELLQKYPLEQGDAIVALKIMFDDPISDRIGDFYVDDPSTLQKIKSKWVTTGPAPYFLCGYHYRIHVLAKGVVKESFSLNLERGCNTIVDERGEARWFSPSLIEKFEGVYKKPRIEKKTFETLKSAREYLASIKGDPQVLMTVEPEWIRFDGTLAFSYSCDAAKGEGGSDDKCLESVSNQLRRKFPKEEFQPKIWARSYRQRKLERIDIRLSCMDSFRKKFDLFPIKKDGWSPFKPELRVVFRS
jgi:hypothetical protein